MQRIPKRSLKQPPASRRACSGFTYIGVLIMVAVMGVMLSSLATIWHNVQQREKEQQLLFIGKQFSRAINAYYQNSPGGANQFPKKLEDLLQDRRYPMTKRYLRKIFRDPITGDAEWGLLKGADSGIIGVYSLSDIAPLKTSNFGNGYGQLEGKKHYSEWQFMYANASGNMPFTPTAAPAATTSSPAGNAAPPASPPPAYSAPPPQPPPKDPTPDQRKQFLCQIMRSNDARICSAMVTKFGNAAGATCIASANARYNACTTSSDNTGMPPLAVQY